MSLAGVRTTNVSNLTSLADQIVVNRNGSTALQPVGDLATQLAGSGVVATRLDSVDGTLAVMANDVDTLETSVAGHSSAIAALQATAASGSHRAEAVTTVTTANVNLAGGGLANGTTHGGVTVVTGQRVLVRAQTAGAEHGIWTVPASGAATRAADADSAAELLGVAVKVTGGIYAGTVFGCVTPAPIVLGTTALAFEKIDSEASVVAALTVISDAVRRDLGATEPSVVGGALKPARAANMASRYDTFDSGAGTRLQWLSTFIMGSDDRIDALRVYISDEARTPVPATIEALLYRQPAALASSAAPVNISQYELIDTLSQPVGRYYTTGGGFQIVTLPIAAKPSAKKGERYAYVLRLRDAGGNMLPFAMGYSRHQTNDEEAFAKGGYATNTALTSFAAVSANNKAYCEVLALRPDDANQRSAVCLTPVDGRVQSVQWGVDFTRVGLHLRPERGVERPGAIGFFISSASGVAWLRLRAFLRPFTDGNYAASPYIMGSEANDKMVLARDFRASDLFEPLAAYASEPQFVTLPLDGMPAIGRDQIAMFEVTGYTADRVTAATFRVAQSGALAAGTISQLLGSYSSASPPTTVQNATTPHYAVLMEQTFSVGGVDVATPLAERLQFLDGLAEFQSTPASVALPRLGVWSADQMRVMPATTLALTDVSGTEAVNNAINLTYNVDAAMSFRWWSTLTVTRNSDNAVLVEGVDYAVSSPGGTIRGLQNIAPVAVTVSASASRARIDLITWFAGAYTVFPGTARLADPDNWRQRVESIASNGRIAVAEVLVTRAGVEVIDKTRVRPGSQVIVGRELEVEAIREWNRTRLAALRLELQRGNGITHIAYGDSITAWTQGYQTDGGTNYHLVPNGPYRDRRDSLGVQTPDDSLANIGLPGVVEGDGQIHWYGSFSRLIRDRLATRYGIAVDYKNLGVGGTDASSSGDGSTGNRWGGSNGTRLAAAVAAKGATGKTLATICFCTNDADDDQIVNRLSDIARAFIAGGVFPVLIGQPALAYGSTRSIRRQQRNDARIVRAARTIPCAYVPLGLITHENRAASGIFRSLQSCAGGVNHPGAFEHAAYAEFIDFMCFR